MNPYWLELYAKMKVYEAVAGVVVMLLLIFMFIVMEVSERKVIQRLIARITGRKKDDD